MRSARRAEAVSVELGGKYAQTFVISSARNVIIVH